MITVDGHPAGFWKRYATVKYIIPEQIAPIETLLNRTVKFVGSLNVKFPTAFKPKSVTK